MATTQKVTAVLRKAGGTFAQEHKSGMIRGWSDWSEGYKVRKHSAGKVRVSYEVGWQRSGPTTVQHSAKKLDEARDALLGAGLRVEIGRAAVGGFFWLIVSD